MPFVSSATETARPKSSAAPACATACQLPPEVRAPAQDPVGVTTRMAVRPVATREVAVDPRVAGRQGSRVRLFDRAERIRREERPAVSGDEHHAPPVVVERRHEPGGEDLGRGDERPGALLAQPVPRSAEVELRVASEVEARPHGPVLGDDRPSRGLGGRRPRRHGVERDLHGGRGRVGGARRTQGRERDGPRSAREPRGASHRGASRRANRTRSPSIVSGGIMAQRKVEVLGGEHPTCSRGAGGPRRTVMKARSAKSSPGQR